MYTCTCISFLAISIYAKTLRKVHIFLMRIIDQYSEACFISENIQSCTYKTLNEYLSLHSQIGVEFVTLLN